LKGCPIPESNSCRHASIRDGSRRGGLGRLSEHTARAKGAAKMPTLEQVLFYCLAAAVYCTLRVAARVLVCVRSLAIQAMILIFDDLPVAGGGG